MVFHEQIKTKLLCLINYCQLHSSTTLLGSPAASPKDFLLPLHTHLTGLKSQISPVIYVKKNTSRGVSGGEDSFIHRNSRS